ncbi:glycosyltransferase [Kordiimonas sp.]|uniref:glycosyltransferase n=1 Tax=Kordiimonas sp. TaxID=1970157 RepID=UPI003B526FC9
MNSELTIVIVAKDAATTIGRAVASARASGDWPILLIDDCSGDETIKSAQDMGGNHITAHQTERSIGIGNARQTALEYTQTEFAMWLDADDEILPHRPAAMLQSLKNGADLCFDPAVLFDPSSGKDTQALPIPDFLSKPDGVLRSFERNWIPALTGGFRTGFAQTVGYDRTFKCAEDYDFLLRAITQNAKIDFLRDAGYRYAHSPTSASRNVELTRAASQAALAKHNFSEMRRRVENSTLPGSEQYLTLAHIATALDLENEWNSVITKLGKSSEAVPPYDRSGKWLSAYLRATAALLSGDHRLAASLLTPLTENDNAADAHNNLGIALWHLGDHTAARVHWQKALAIMPRYLDATENLRAAKQHPTHITHAPLRRAPSRSGYKR